MVWDKDNPPVEFWGFDMQFGREQRLLTPALPYLWVAVVATYIVVFVGVLLALDWATWIFPLFPIGIFVLGFIAVEILVRAVGTSQSLYYQFFDDAFRIRVDVTGPITIRAELFKRPMHKTFRFIDDDVKTLSVSEQSVHMPPLWEDSQAIRLAFTLHNGSTYCHTQRLLPEVGGEYIANLREFQALLDRLESILGPDRIETAERLKSARDALQRRLREPGKPNEMGGIDRARSRS